VVGIADLFSMSDIDSSPIHSSLAILAEKQVKRLTPSLAAQRDSFRDL
jgi:hypothetical protein